jgi:TorA maturation chaperone TorD
MADQTAACSEAGESPVALRKQAAGWRFLSQLLAEAPDNVRIQQARAFLSAFGIEPRDEDGDEIRADYLRLFVGLRKTLAPPWESVYLAPGRRVFQEPALAVRRAYLEASLAHDRMFEKPDDHISLELEFLACLEERIAAAWDAAAVGEADQARAARRRFLQEHLGRWASAFGGDIRAHAATEFWRGVGVVLIGLFSPSPSSGVVESRKECAQPSSVGTGA